jgi:hypothetical protein
MQIHVHTNSTHAHIHAHAIKSPHDWILIFKNNVHLVFLIINRGSAPVQILFIIRGICIRVHRSEKLILLQYKKKNLSKTDGELIRKSFSRLQWMFFAIVNLVNEAHQSWLKDFLTSSHGESFFSIDHAHTTQYTHEQVHNRE